LAGNTSYLGINGTHYITYNLHGTNTTVANIFWTAEGGGHLKAIVHYVGHGSKEYVWNGIFYEEQWFIHDNFGAKVYDKDIYTHSVCKNVFFIFMDACHQGDVIGGKHLSQTPFGMLYAWRQSNQMSQDGYADLCGDGLFIGFEGASPFLTKKMAGVSEALKSSN
jgi:hypothetical protein